LTLSIYMIPTPSVSHTCSKVCKHLYGLN